MGSDRGDRPKKSWREIDSMRDKSAQRDARRGDDRPGSQAQRSSKQYRAALEALFEKGGLAKIAEKLEEKSGPLPGTSPSAPPASPTSPTSKAPQGQRVVAPAADEGKAALRRKIVEAIGRDEITRAVDRYLKEYPLPDDYEVLEQAIEHRKSDRVTEALGAIERMLDGQKPKRTRVLAAKLRLIEETSDEKEIRATAARLRARIG